MPPSDLSYSDGPKGPTAAIPDGGVRAGDGNDDLSEIVIAARDRFRRGLSFVNTNRTLALADTQFVLGDSDNLWQWPTEYAEERSRSSRVVLTINATAQHCNQIINDIRQRRPAVKISPVDDGADKETADILAGLVRNIHATSQSDIAHDVAIEHAVYGGEGYSRVVTEYKDDTSFDQCIRVKPIMDPNLVVMDPAAVLPDRSDAQWCFVFERIHRSDFERMFPDCDPVSWNLPNEIASDWYDTDTVLVAEYFWCEYSADELWLMPDGPRLKSDLKGGKRPEQWRKVTRKQWKWAKLCGGEDQPMDTRDWPGSLMPVVAYIGKEVIAGGEVVRKGLVRDLKDPARMLNYSYSEAVQTVALQNKAPYMAAAEAIESFEDEWKNANVTAPLYLPFNAYDDDGNPLPAPSRQETPQLAVAQVQLMQIATDQLRAASGQHASNFGIKSEAKSGIGIERLKVQGDTATFHFPDNFRRSLHYEARVIVDLIQRVYDVRRVERTIGLDGKESSAVLEPELRPGEYREIPSEDGDADKIVRLFNPGLMQYDITIDTGPSYSTQRQEGFSAMMEIASGAPAIMEKAGDLVFEAADFPMADKIAARLRRALPPGLTEDDPTATLQQQLGEAQQIIEQGSAQNEALQAEVARLKAERSGKVIDNQAKLLIAKGEQDVDAYRAETDRIAAVQAPATMLDPAALQAVIMQSLRDILSSPDALDQIMAPPPAPQQLQQMQQPMNMGGPDQGPPMQQPPMPPDGMGPTGGMPGPLPPAGGAV